MNNWSYKYRTRKMYIEFARTFNMGQVNVSSPVAISLPNFVVFNER